MGDTTKCVGCFWFGSCSRDDNQCDDYTPLDELADIEHYNSVIRENTEEYDALISEMR